MSKDAKTRLKELADSGKLPPANFSTERVGGTDHEPAYLSTIEIDGKEAQGTGRSRTAAEQNASAAYIQEHGDVSPTRRK